VDGLTNLDEILKERIASLKLDRDRAKTALDRIKCRSTESKIDHELIERFGRAMRENITSGNIPFRKAYIQAVVDWIELDDHAVRISGDKATLEQVIAGHASTGAGVRSFVRKWRAIRNKTTNSYVIEITIQFIPP
jgi:site-specific DNA recombinase